MSEELPDKESTRVCVESENNKCALRLQYVSVCSRQLTLPAIASTLSFPIKERASGLRYSITLHARPRSLDTKCQSTVNTLIHTKT